MYIRYLLKPELTFAVLMEVTIRPIVMMAPSTRRAIPVVGGGNVVGGRIRRGRVDHHYDAGVVCAARGASIGVCRREELDLVDGSWSGVVPGTKRRTVHVEGGPSLHRRRRLPRTVSILDRTQAVVRSS